MSAKTIQYTFQDVTVPSELITGALENVSPVVLKILYKRGYRTAEALTHVLFDDIEWSLSHTALQDIERAVPLLQRAIMEKSQIVVYQDYDVDGCAASALCLEALRQLGATVHNYVNHREIDGYGICIHGIDCILSRYPDTKLIMTVDNGIVAHEAIAYAKEKGLAVIVTDHHAPGETLPPADAVIDPKRIDETYPFPELCGTGVAFKVILALYNSLGEDITAVQHTLDLVALATVADIVPLIGENRVLVREGLRMMNQHPRPAFRMMCELLNIQKINAHTTIAFQFSPMINALSRMGADADIAVQIFLETREDILRRQVMKLIALNEQRKEETKRETEIARTMIDEDNLPSAIILENDSFQEGIIGIVAGRLMNLYHRPVIICSPGKEGILKASCRSVEGFHMKEQLDKVADLLLVYGGHAKAAGFSIRRENFSAFREALLQLSDTVDPKTWIDKRELDAVLDIRQVSVPFIQTLQQLEPFGEGNPQPLFGLCYTYNTIQFFGADKQHVRYQSNSYPLTILEWQGAERERKRHAQGKKRCKAIGVLELNEYNGRVSPQFRIIN